MINRFSSYENRSKSQFISKKLMSQGTYSSINWGETLYRWGESGNHKWMELGDKDAQPKYQGYVKDGKPNGLGFMISPNGDKYVGGWKNGMFNDQGIFSKSNGTKHAGIWKIDDGFPSHWNGKYYKDLDVYKTTYDFVIYWMLISELKPNTIIEYGSGSGGSAIWLADISTAMGLDINVISYDIKLPNVTHPKVQFVELDLTQDFVEEVHWSGKKLVIEDAHVNVKSVLLKTDLHLKVGDYLIVDDSDGKQSEIVDFLFNAKNTYKTDNYYLDFFERNTTCCVDSIFKVF